MKFKMKHLALAAGALISAAVAGQAQAAHNDHGKQQCREFTKDIYIDGRRESGYGTACLQADGSWQIVSDAPQASTHHTERIIVRDRTYPTSGFHISIGNGHRWGHHRWNRPHRFHRSHKWLKRKHHKRRGHGGHAKHHRAKHHVSNHYKRGNKGHGRKY